MKGLVPVLAIAVAALAASTAPAAELTSPSGTMVATGTTIHAESEGHAVLDSPIGEIKCSSTVQGKTTNTGGATETVTTATETLTFTGCTNGAVVSVLAKGSLEIHGVGSSNGTLTSTGAEVTVELFGAHCIFKTSGTDIGTLTGSEGQGGNHATLDISATIPRVGGRSGALCGSSAPWTGSYQVTSPAVLNVDKTDGGHE